MNNLDLHNKLLEIAKAVEVLREQHPELEPELHVIEDLFHTETAASLRHPVAPHLYRTDG